MYKRQGLVIGVGSVLGYELSAGTIHGAETLTRLLGAPPLTVIPAANRPHPFARLNAWIAKLKARASTSH